MTCERIRNAETVDAALAFAGLKNNRESTDGGDVVTLDVRPDPKRETIEEAQHIAKTMLGRTADHNPALGAVYRLTNVESEILEA